MKQINPTPHKKVSKIKTKLPPTRKPKISTKPIPPQIVNDANKVAFIGRSNSGKSSLINYLLGRQAAKTSKTPGKTRKHELIKFSNTITLVDMPGYGYARISKDRRGEWEKDLQRLFFEDIDLVHVFVLIDSSIKPTGVDQDFVSWLVGNGVIHSLIYTKIDKISQKEKSQNIRLWNEFLELLPYTYKLTAFEASALKKKGAGDLNLFIETLKKKS